MWWRFTGPDEFAVAVSFGEDAHEAWLTVEDAACIGISDARVAPCGVDGDAHLILIEMCCAGMEAHDSGGGASWDLVQAGALGGRY